MAEITNQIRKSYGLLPSFVPADVLGKIQQDELYDRLVEAQALVTRSNASSSPTVRKALGELARDVLGAQPRADTEREVAGLLRKAAASPDPRSAEMCRTRAAQLRERNPIAPRRAPARPIAKAKSTDDLVAVYDVDGTLVGMCKPDAITALVSAKPADDATAEKDAAATVAAEKPLGTAKQPPAAETPAAAGQPGAVAKGAVRVGGPRTVQRRSALGTSGYRR